MISNLETQRENLVDVDEKVRDAKKITIDNTSSIIIHRFVVDMACLGSSTNTISIGGYTDDYYFGCYSYFPYHDHLYYQYFDHDFFEIMITQHHDVCIQISSLL